MANNLLPVARAWVALPAWVFVALCAIAGALAVPLDTVATGLAALVGGLAGFSGLHLWVWSRLPAVMETGPAAGVGRLLRPAAMLGLGLGVGSGSRSLGPAPLVPAVGAGLRPPLRSARRFFH